MHEELESKNLDEAKRYVKRYYIRPQNVFCSNKEDILRALAEAGDQNCSIYSLKNLDDHDDVHLLKPSDIIYYYDDHVLYDKNHVQVLDYDLFVKHEEERKRFGNVDAISDTTFDKEYEDRLTEAINEEAGKMELTEEKLKAFDKMEDEKGFNKSYLPTLQGAGLIGQRIFREHRSLDYYTGGWKKDNMLHALDITGFAVGAKTGKMFILTRQTGDKLKYRIDDYFEFSSRWDSGNFKYTHDNKIVDDAFTAYKDARAAAIVSCHKAIIDANAAERTVANRALKVSTVSQILKELTPEEEKKLREWSLLNVVSMKFRIPKIDDDLAKLPTEGKSLEKIDYERAKIERDFAMYEDEFKAQFPGAKLGVDYTYRYTSAEKDTTYNLWRPSGRVDLRSTVGEAPVEVKDILEKVKLISETKGFQVKKVDAMAKDNYVESYYFCLLLVKFYNGDINFYRNQDVALQQEPAKPEQEPDNPFDLEFDAVNAYGEKLTEGKEEVCCICGEPINGYGNNPEPYKHEGRCCDACNAKFVIPARIERMLGNNGEGESDGSAE